MKTLFWNYKEDTELFLEELKKEIPKIAVVRDIYKKEIDLLYFRKELRTINKDVQILKFYRDGTLDVLIFNFTNEPISLETICEDYKTCHKK